MSELGVRDQLLRAGYVSPQLKNLVATRHTLNLKTDKIIMLMEKTIHFKHKLQILFKLLHLKKTCAQEHTLTIKMKEVVSRRPPGCLNNISSTIYSQQGMIQMTMVTCDGTLH